MIVVFGSLNMDCIMSVRSLPRPGETVVGGHYRLLPGGKGANQACAAARAGPEQQVVMVGTVGDDVYAEPTTALLAEAGVDLRYLARGAEPTGYASVCVDEHGENAIAVASGANHETQASQVPDELLGPDTWLVLQMEVPAKENALLVARAAAAGARIILNVAPAATVADTVLDSVGVMVVNEVEAATIAGGSGDPAEIGREIAHRHDLTCITTLGADGAVAFGAGGGGWSVGSLPLNPFDTTGAGDGFVGILATCLDAGKSMPDALRFASAGAGLACMCIGAQPAYGTHDEITERLSELAPAKPVE